MDSARDAPVQLHVNLWEDVLFVDGRLGKIPDSSLLDNVLDEVPLDGLVLLVFFKKKKK